MFFTKEVKEKVFMAQTGFTTYLVKGMVVGEPVQQVC